MRMMMVVALGGAVGALGRFWLAALVHRFAGFGFPHGTLAVNVIGSFLMGVAFVLLNERLQGYDHFRHLATVGFLGAFTTFSTFAMDTLSLLETGELLKAALNVLASVILCLAACAMGAVIARSLPL